MSKCFRAHCQSLLLIFVISNAFNAIVFVEWHRYINISTISPCAVLVRKVPNGTPLFHLYTSKRKPAICISLVSCCESFLTRLPPSGIQHKRVGVRFHSQEWERLVGFVCTVFREPVLEAQLSGGVTQISTRGPNTFKSTLPAVTLTMVDCVHSPMSVLPQMRPVHRRHRRRSRGSTRPCKALLLERRPYSPFRHRSSNHLLSMPRIIVSASCRLMRSAADAPDASPRLRL